MHSCAPVRSLVVILLIVFASQVASAQFQAPPSASQPIRDQQAITVVQSAIAAMGGASAVSAIVDTTVSGMEPDLSNPGGPPVPFTWQTSGAEFRNTIQNS